MKMHRYETIGRSYFDTAPVRLDDRLEIDFPAEVAFKIFEDNEAWHEFDPGIASAKWTSPLPLRPGSTRRVKLNKWLGSGTIDEVFFEWKPSEHFAFYMHAGTSKLIHGYAELWNFTDLGNGRTELRLRTAFALNGWFISRFVRLFSPILNLGYRGTLKDVKKYLEKHASA